MFRWDYSQGVLPNIGMQFKVDCMNHTILFSKWISYKTVTRKYITYILFGFDGESPNGLAFGEFPCVQIATWF